MNILWQSRNTQCPCQHQEVTRFQRTCWGLVIAVLVWWCVIWLAFRLAERWMG